jgi:hypothetical protein
VSFVPAREGGTYQITSGVSANSYAAANSFGVASNSGTCQQTQVRYIR